MSAGFVGRPYAEFLERAVAGENQCMGRTEEELKP